MNDLIGIDTNILVYAFDTAEGDKYREAKQLVPELIRSGNAVLSAQNLTEFFFVTTSRIERPISREVALTNIEDFRKSPASIEAIEPGHPAKAARLKQENETDYWDCLLATTLKEAGVRKIYTENVDDFQSINMLDPENPFSQH